MKRSKKRTIELHTRAGYLSLYEQYGKDEKYKEFFSKVEIEEMYIIIGNRKFGLIHAPHNEKDIFSGDFEKSGQKGISKLTYITGDAGMERAKLHNKKLFKSEGEANAFINKFPGETKQEKIFSFITLFNLQKSGFWDPFSDKWTRVNTAGYVALSEVNKIDNVYHVRWNENQAGIVWDQQENPQPMLVFQEC